MKELENRINSVELCEIINRFRVEEKTKTEKDKKVIVLQHKSLMEKIRKELEVMEKLGITNGQNILLVKYTDKKGETRPCYSLNASGMRQILNSESVYVRAKTEEYITKLEKENRELQNTDISTLIKRIESLEKQNTASTKRIESLEKQVRILSANPNNYKEFKSLTSWLKEYGIPTNKANEILVELKIMKRDKDGYSLGDYVPTTWGVVKLVQGTNRVYWSAIGFEKIIPKIQKKWDQKKLVSGQYEQAKMEI